MECNKWEETGLLYVSRELDELDLTEFKNHLSTCTFCSNELSQYNLEKTRFFSPSTLSIQTTPELDIKILTRCLSVRQTHLGLVGMTWFKRIVFSSLVFAFGAGAGGYFTFAYYHAKSDAAIAAASSKSMKAPLAVTTAPAPMTQTASALSSDTTKPHNNPGLFKKNGRTAPSATGIGQTQGIITVDLKKE
jgi:hypothetical protein